MDIFKITSIRPLTQTSGTTKTKENTEREPDQGGQQAASGREEPASQEEADKAAQRLATSPHFIANALTVEVRESDAKYFLDIFDPQKRKIKTIGAVGIRAILSSYNTGASATGSRILDRRV